MLAILDGHRRKAIINTSFIVRAWCVTKITNCTFYSVAHTAWKKKNIIPFLSFLQSYKNLFFLLLPDSGTRWKIFLLWSVRDKLQTLSAKSYKKEVFFYSSTFCTCYFRRSHASSIYFLFICFLCVVSQSTSLKSRIVQVYSNERVDICRTTKTIYIVEGNTTVIDMRRVFHFYKNPTVTFKITSFLFNFTQKNEKQNQWIEKEK